MDINLCIICDKSVADNKLGEIVKKPRIAGIESLIQSAVKRKDKVFTKIRTEEELLRSMKYNFKYHRHCFQTYTSTQNIEESLVFDDTASSSNAAHKSREGSQFNIRKMCFICNKSGTVKKKKLTPISTGSGESTRNRVLEAAKSRNDYDMIAKMSLHTDLFALDAKYHPNCYSRYINKRNIRYSKKSENVIQKSELSEVGKNPSPCDSSTPRSDNFEASDSKIVESELNILHKAAQILRKSLGNYGTTAENTYFSPQEVTLEYCKKQIPQELLHFVSFVLNDESFATGALSDQVDMSILATCNAFLGNCNIKRKRSCLSLCLGLQIYYTTKSKANIELLYKMGYSCSYDEIRRFLTNMATANLQKFENIYVPSGLAEVSMKNYIHASIDNFDLNEETIDGKNTTHCMAMVVFQQQTKESQKTYDKISRNLSRSLTYENVDFQKLNTYPKQNKRPEPPRFSENYFDNTPKYEDYVTSSRKDLLWCITRTFKSSETSLSWTDFNNLFASNKVPLTEIYYLPFINAPPTDYDTILTALTSLVKVAHHLKQNHIVVTADLAIYSKAQEILWNDSTDISKYVTLQVGGMHLMMAFIASVGTIFGDGGLKNILVEADIFAENTCHQILQGKQYSRGIRALTLTADALTRLFLKELVNWAEDKEQLANDEIKEFVNTVISGHYTNFEDVEQRIITLESWMKLFEEYGENNSSTFKYWMSFFKGVNLLWRYLRAERNGEFENHLLSVREMIPYLRAGGRHNYAKYIPIYISDMQQLKSEHPDMYNFLSEGNFVVKKTDNKIFNCVASDMALEQSINRDCKSSGGVIGFTQNSQTLLRWLVTRHSIGNYVTKFESLVNRRSDEALKRQSSGMKKRDEDDVTRILNMFEQQWTNPFKTDCTSDLINITTGRVTPKEIETDLTTFLLNAQNNGDNYIRKTFLSNSNNSFWKPIKKEKIRTFADIAPNKQCSLRKKITYIGTEAMFRRVLNVAQLKDCDMKHIMSFELTLIPLSLFHEDGTMRKTIKSDLKLRLENHADLCYEYPTNIDSTIIDGMAMIQEIKEKKRTFNELCNVIMQKLLSLMHKIKNVVVVFDRYDKEISLKSVERKRRGDNSDSVYNINGNRYVPKYKEFLQSSRNKQNLIIFLSQYLCENKDIIPSDNKIIIAGGFEDGEVCKTISKDDIVLNSNLKSNHEEADTRIILHLIEQSQYFNCIVVKSDDTDVLVLLLYTVSMHKNLREKKIYLQTGHTTATTNKFRFIDVNSIIANLGEGFCKLLLPIHALTGCDTTSSFFKIGKKTVFDVALKNVDNLSAFRNFASATPEDAMNIAREFIVLLYKSPDSVSLNDLRYKQTLVSKPPAEIPPTEDSFSQHVLRCLLQTKIWQMSDIAMTPEFDISEYGWKMEDGVVSALLMTKEPIPKIIRNSLNIDCKDKNCITQKCPCLKENLKCTILCKCKECKNVEQTEELALEDDDF